jgi:formylmethanofuran dehydrogenase subunit E
MDCKPTPHYYCPVCGEEVYETVFVDNDGEILGCEHCAEIKEPHEVLESETE